MIVPLDDAVDSYLGDTSTTQFPYNFAIEDETELEVLLDGVALVLNSNYTLTGVGEELGGVVTITPPPGNDVVVTLLRNQPFRQESVYTTNEDFPAQRLQKDLNKLSRMLKQLKESVGRSLKFSKDSLLTLPELPDGVVDEFLVWETTTKLRNVSAITQLGSSVALPLSIVNGGTASATAGAARTALAAAGLADENVFTKRQHWQKGADIASASALAPGTDGNFFHVTGTTTITSIGSAVAGSVLMLKFDSALTVTHHATNLILREAVNMAAAAGDVLVLVSEGTGKWREIARTQAQASGLLLGHLGGLGLTNNATDPTNDIDFAVGEAVSDDALITNRVLLNAGAMTKRLDAVWAAGTGAGGLAAADNLTGAKTLHAWIFRRSGGTDDYFFSTSLAPTIPDSGTKKRRIASFIWDGSAVERWIQDGDFFQLKTPLIGYDATNPGTSAVTVTLAHLPVGIKLRAVLNHGVYFAILGPARTLMLVSDLASDDQVPSETAAPLGTSGNETATEGLMPSQVTVMSNVSAQVRSRLNASDASTKAKIVVMGWHDRRGRG